jgi:hypothetical protein
MKNHVDYRNDIIQYAVTEPLEQLMYRSSMLSNLYRTHVIVAVITVPAPLLILLLGTLDELGSNVFQSASHLFDAPD